MPNSSKKNMTYVLEEIKDLHVDVLDQVCKNGYTRDYNASSFVYLCILIT